MDRILHFGEIGRDQRFIEQDIVEHDLFSGNIPCGRLFRMNDDERVLPERELPAADNEIPLPRYDERDLPELTLEPFAQIIVVGPVFHIQDGKREIMTEKQILPVNFRFYFILHHSDILFSCDIIQYNLPGTVFKFKSSFLDIFDICFISFADSRFRVDFHIPRIKLP